MKKYLLCTLNKNQILKIVLISLSIDRILFHFEFLFKHFLFFLIIMTGANTDLPLLLPLLPPAPPSDSLHPVPVTHPHAGRPLLWRMFGVDWLGCASQLHDVAEADTGSGFGVVVVLEDGRHCNIDIRRKRVSLPSLY